MKQSHGRHVNFGFGFGFGLVAKTAKQSELGKKKFYNVLDTQTYVHKIHVVFVVWPTCFVTCLFYALFALIPLADIHCFLNLCLHIFGVMSAVWLL